ncbi:phosphatidylglycerophosphatase A [Amylibacter marinus]|uniref:Phosphatidylglycerophosphatase A n=1 Tax=Amylibacter marinus TaxID=1475483 RepID=A0ABQ5VT34_9RHOB|nr:phosphatidylglycerophosphatase A [Amylibacter marinus]GLQ34326.1 phosphatidylglycerophosphatase A [Amylibacter marinus]
MTKLIATWFYAGLIRPAPGTWGSLAALPFAWAMLWFGFGVWCLLLASALIFLLGWWATYEETKGKADHDPSEIVIDEVVGQWLALIPVFAGVHLGMSLWFSFALGFGLFRLFDITKPFPVSWADRMDTALGVMLDDVIAGIMAALCLWGAGLVLVGILGS